MGTYGRLSFHKLLVMPSNSLPSLSRWVEQTSLIFPHFPIWKMQNGRERCKKWTCCYYPGQKIDPTARRYSTCCKHATSRRCLKFFGQSGSNCGPLNKSHDSFEQGGHGQENLLFLIPDKETAVAGKGYCTNANHLSLYFLQIPWQGCICCPFQSERTREREREGGKKR